MKKNTMNSLKRNTIIIAVSNIGSKAISFILAPLYSFFLSSEQYGIMDLIITTAGLLMPLLCLDIYDATFRYSSDTQRDGETVLESSLFICWIECLVVGVGLVLINCIFNVSIFVVACVIAAVLDSIYNVLAQYARGQGKMLTFASAGIVNALSLLAGNIVLLFLLDLNLTGWIIAFIGAKIIAIIFLCISQKLFRNFLLRKVEFSFLKEALLYCIPLMPTAAMWWIMNVSDRYVINITIGISATGIYAVANKLPAILSVFENIFYQSWQTTAINLIDDDDRDKLYSVVLLNYGKVLTIGVLGILIVLKPFILYCFASEYCSAWKCAGVLVVGILVHAMGGNLGILYTVFKNTKGALKTSAFGAAINFILNIIFVPLFGMNAAAWTTLTGYLCVLALRWKDSLKYVKFSLQNKDLISIIVVLFIQLCLYYVDGYISFAAKCLVFMIYFGINRDILLKLLVRRSRGGLDINAM